MYNTELVKQKVCTTVSGVHLGGSPIIGGGTNRIDYITIQPTGNAVDFGDLSFLIMDRSHTGLSQIMVELFMEATVLEVLLQLRVALSIHYNFINGKYSIFWRLSCN